MMVTLILIFWFETINSKQKKQKAEKNEKLVVFDRNLWKMQTYVNPY